MNIRSCPICSSTKYKVIFSFDYDYVLNVLKLDAKLLELVDFKEGSFSNIVNCLSCNSSYIREDFEIDNNLDAYFELNQTDYQNKDHSNINQGVRKTWLDKLTGKEFVNNSILNILSAYCRKDLYSPIAEKPVKLLDFGCGWGNWLKQLTHYNFIDCYGYDINKFKVNSLNQLGINAFYDIDEIRKVGLFDIIICNDVIEHVDNPNQVMETLGSLIKPGGVLYAAVPRFSKKDMIKASLEMKKRKRLKLFHLGHINYLTPEAFKGAMATNGFKPINSQTTSITWVSGPIKSNLIGLAKFIIKIILYPFTSKYTNIWMKS